MPYLTANLPGTGGQLKSCDDDFCVTEVPAYAPQGIGTHVFARIRKRDATTNFAVAQLAQRLGIAARDIGYAGLKDRHAVTEQWLSFPPPLTVEAVLSASTANVQVCEAAYHPHKLRTGHLVGNDFVVRVRALTCPPTEALQRAEAIRAVLSRPPGALNWYGEQRFGRDQATLTAGLTAVRDGQRVQGGPRALRFALSALQAHWFNQWLEARFAAGTSGTALAGDMLRKRHGGYFLCTDPAGDTARIQAGEVVLTGPMFGAAMRGPAIDSAPAAMEAELLAATGVSTQQLQRWAKLMPGTRREATLAIRDFSCALQDEALELRFGLDAGAYATVVVREITKSSVAPARADRDRTDDASATESDGPDGPIAID